MNNKNHEYSLYVAYRYNAGQRFTLIAKTKILSKSNGRMVKFVLDPRSDLNEAFSKFEFLTSDIEGKFIGKFNLVVDKKYKDIDFNKIKLEFKCEYNSKMYFDVVK